MDTEEDTAGEIPSARRMWRVIALVIFSLALVTPFHRVWQQDLHAVVPLPADYAALSTDEDQYLRAAFRTDLRFHVSVIGRHARTLLTDPLSVYDTPHCFPASNSLLLGEPMLTLGVQAIPGYLLTRDPIVAFNSMLVLSVLLSAFFMYLLIEDWTGEPAAAIAAGLLYAFGVAKLRGVAHPFINDTSWTVLAIYFARRTFALGRTRDALGVGLAVAMQIGGSFYALLSAVVIAIPCLGWLQLRYGYRSLRIRPVLGAFAMIATAASIVLIPYLLYHEGPDLHSRGIQVLERWSSLLPGEPRFPGWLCIGLVAAAFAIPKARSLRGSIGDPRWALLIAFGLIGLIAADEPTVGFVPNLFDAFSSIVPGLKSVRRPGEMMSGIHLVLCVLAGIGAAGLLRSLPPLAARWAKPLPGLVLVSLAYVVTLQPASLGLSSPMVYEPFVIKPAKRDLEFYRDLELAGNRGPVVTYPIDWREFETASVEMMLALYHRRPISACYSSYIPDEAVQVFRMTLEGIDRDALARLADDGFTTLVLNQRAFGPSVQDFEARLSPTGAKSRPFLRRIHSAPPRIAYEIVIPESAADDRSR